MRGVVALHSNVVCLSWGRTAARNPGARRHRYLFAVSVRVRWCACAGGDAPAREVAVSQRGMAGSPCVLLRVDPYGLYAWLPTAIDRSCRPDSQCLSMVKLVDTRPGGLERGHVVTSGQIMRWHSAMRMETN